MGSSPLRTDGSRDDQAGEAGPVVHSSAEDKSLRLDAKGLSGCHPSGQQPRQPDGKARGQIKDYLFRIFWSSHRVFLNDVYLDLESPRGSGFWVGEGRRVDEGTKRESVYEHQGAEVDRS